MFHTRRIRGFFFTAVLIYGILIISWPGLGSEYAGCFRACGNLLFSDFGSDGTVQLLPSGPEIAGDTEVRLTNVRGQQSWRIAYNSRYTGYMPTAAIIALTLATPVAWRRRWQALFWGMTFVHVFILVRFALSLVYNFRKVGLFVYGEFWSRTIQIAYEAISVSIVTSCVVPVLIWIAVALRREDLGLPPVIRARPDGPRGRTRRARRA